jgi:hypothetical protein
MEQKNNTQKDNLMSHTTSLQAKESPCKEVVERRSAKKAKPIPNYLLPVRSDKLTDRVERALAEKRLEEFAKFLGALLE